jgi:hypothetical protein
MERDIERTAKLEKKREADLVKQAEAERKSPDAESHSNLTRASTSHRPFARHFVVLGCVPHPPRHSMPT